MQVSEISLEGGTESYHGNLRIHTHVFGAKSSRACANYALQQTARDNKKQHPLAAYVIERNFYLDDFVKSVKGSEAGVAIYEDLKAVLPKGGFQLKKWLSNPHIVMVDNR